MMCVSNDTVTQWAFEFFVSKIMSTRSSPDAAGRFVAGLRNGVIQLSPGIVFEGNTSPGAEKTSRINSSRT
jgi:hypothetical protein